MQMARASARHILVKTEEACVDLKQKIDEGGADFADMAKKHSECPSGNNGGWRDNHWKPANG